MATRSDMYGILFEEVLIEEGFNVRYDMGDLQELSNSIVENGIQNPIIAHTKKGDINRYTLIEGHRRIAAVELAIKQKKLDPKEFRIPMVKGRNLSDIDRTYGLVTMNSGKNLTPLEEATVYQRLVNYGVTAAQIAKRTGKSPTHISNCLELTNANLGTRKMIMDGTVSATLVIDLLKKKDPGVVEIELKDLLAKKKAEVNQRKPFIDETENAPKQKKDTTASDDVPGKQDNTKTTGANTKTLPEAKANKPVRITKKNLEPKVKERTFIREQIKNILLAFKEECVGYQERKVPIDLDIENWIVQNVD